MTHGPRRLAGAGIVPALAWLCLTGCEESAGVSLPDRNLLGGESSPYLLQHADNPVHWRPWGDEAFAEAQARDVPVLVSIGYSACHWCHVMEHECFEDPEIARVMNERFVCVKVDREERPDVDEVYMTAVQMMGIGGGWPLNVFVTPDRRPFFGGTYFPPEDRYGRPGWPTVLVRVSEAWNTNRAEITEQAGRLTQALQESSGGGGTDLPEAGVLETARDQIASRFDARFGGFGGAPKFPPAQTLQFLLRRHLRTGSVDDLRMVEVTLDRMARGGMYDQLGGGFHRYSVDAEWLVPHFEKMLYDNAQLARVYVEAWQVTGEEAYARIARETLDYVLREMTEPEGGFRSATDADSDGREGVYFVWRQSEIDSLLGDDAPLFRRAYGVTETGNFEDVHHPRQPGEEGMNVLHLPLPLDELAAAEGMDAAELETRLARSREILRQHRQGRTYPGLDDKVLAGWNGLMIGAMAYAGRALDEPRYVEAAGRAADFVLTRMRDADGGLLRTWRGGSARIPAFLEDHAFLVNALLDLYEATFDLRRLHEARDLADAMNRKFADEAGGWNHTSREGEELVATFRSPTDGSVPGGNGVAAQAMARMAVLFGDEDAGRRAAQALAQFSDSIEKIPAGTIGLLLALDLVLHEDGEVAFVGDPSSPATRALVRPALRAFLPGTAFALLDPAHPGDAESFVPLLAGKGTIGGAPAAYVCRDYACRQPVTEPADLERELAQL